MNIPTPPRDESSETSGDPEASQSPQPSGSGSGGSGGDQDGSDDRDNDEHNLNMAPPRIFEDENGVDDEDWYKKKVEVKWDQKDLLFFFNQLEDAMSFAGIRKQYTKRRILVTNLPKKQVDDLKGLLRLNEANAHRQCVWQMLSLHRMCTCTATYLTIRKQDHYYRLSGESWQWPCFIT